MAATHTTLRHSPATATAFPTRVIAVAPTPPVTSALAIGMRKNATLVPIPVFAIVVDDTGRIYCNASATRVQP